LKRPEDLVARFGGEEFTLLLPHTSAEGALKVVERIRSAVYELGLDHIGNSWNRVTVSIGYTALTPVAGGVGPSRLIQLADAALYQAKSRGRNRVETLSIEVAQAANDQSTTAKNRIVRILGGTEREAEADGRRPFPRERVK
jgi:predicted signal transduction protein with EAL and GGDEF domain